MPIRAYLAAAGLTLTVVLGACRSEVRTPEPDSETGAEVSAALVCPTPVPATALPPQQDLARDIRTVLTGVKSPVQQEALAQAGKIAAGHMSDALREVLVDVAAFVSYLDDWDDTGDPRLDSLAHFLVCALQPHFSQEELTADILSIARSQEERKRLEPVRQARQKTAAWLAMHLPVGDMGDDLWRAVIKVQEYFLYSDFYPMYTAEVFLSEALFRQYAGYSEEDFAAEIARGIPAAEVEQIRQIVQITMQRQAAWAAQDASSEPEVMDSPQANYLPQELAGLSQDELIARIRAIMEKGQYGICGYEPPGWIFQQFPDISVALLAEVITRPTTPLRKMSDGLELLSELAASYKTGWNLGFGEGEPRFSEETIALLIATSRHFLEGEFLSSLPMQDRDDILYSAFRFAVRGGSG